MKISVYIYVPYSESERERLREKLRIEQTARIHPSPRSIDERKHAARGIGECNPPRHSVNQSIVKQSQSQSHTKTTTRLNLTNFSSAYYSGAERGTVTGRKGTERSGG